MGKKYEAKYKHIVQAKYTDEEIEKIADAMFDWFSEKISVTKDNPIPENMWMKDFAIEVMVTKTRFNDFCKKSEYFNYIYSLCQDIQESKLWRLGRSMDIFALKNVARWRDSFDLDNTLNEDETTALKKRAKEVMLQEM